MKLKVGEIATRKKKNGRGKGQGRNRSGKGGTRGCGRVGKKRV